MKKDKDKKQFVPVGVPIGGISATQVNALIVQHNNSTSAHQDIRRTTEDLQEQIDNLPSGGGYTPPIGGIRRMDLAADVQASLENADNALPASNIITNAEIEQIIKEF